MVKQLPSALCLRLKIRKGSNNSQLKAKVLVITKKKETALEFD